MFNKENEVYQEREWHQREEVLRFVPI